MTNTLPALPQNTPNFAHVQEEISSMLSVADKDLTDEQRHLMDVYLNMLACQEAEKIDRFCQFIRLETARMEALKAEAQRLSGMAKTAENRIAFLKMHYLSIMQAYGLRKVKGNMYTASIREVPVVSVENPDMVPDDFWKMKIDRSIDKMMVKNHLVQGKDVPGCILQTSYSLQTR